jgi:hypothetical protein
LFLKNGKELTEKAKSLKKRLEFINHLRNKISGHIDEKVIEKAIQWEPFFLPKTSLNNYHSDGRLILLGLV